MPLRPPEASQASGRATCRSAQTSRSATAAGNQFHMPFMTTGIEVLTNLPTARTPGAVVDPGRTGQSRQHGGESYPHASARSRTLRRSPTTICLLFGRRGRYHQTTISLTSTAASISSRMASRSTMPGQMLLIKNESEYKSNGRARCSLQARAMA